MLPRRPPLGLAGPRAPALAALLAVAFSLLLVASAGATVIVKSTVKEGLVVEGQSGRDVVRLSRDKPEFGGKWDVFRVCTLLEICTDTRYQVGAGCNLDGSAVKCTRFNGKVTVNLFGGDDSFGIGGSGASQPITDSIAVNLSTGNDSANGGPGPDVISGGSGNDSLGGGDGNDELSGSVGEDDLSGDDGNDTLTGGDDPDTLVLGPGADNADGGSGNDRFALGTPSRDERDIVQGGLGSDLASYTLRVTVPGVFTQTFLSARLSALRIIEANLETLAGEKNTSENDVLRSIEAYGGGSGDDIITGVLSSNSDDYLGELGDDQIFGSSGANKLVGGGGHDHLDGNGGNDVIDAKTGEGSTADRDPFIDCGAGSGDLAIVDLSDDGVIVGCEDVDLAPAGESPHVRIRLPRRRGVRVANGRAAFRLTCSRKARRRCRGALRLRVGRASTKRTRFSIRRRRSRRVVVRLGRLQRGVGRRTAARVIARERGRKGPKTTSRRVLLRRSR